jgi:hypothetical protein
LEDPEEIQLQIDVALNGLGQIRQFTRLDKSSPNWQFHTFSNPVRCRFSRSLSQEKEKKTETRFNTPQIHAITGHRISRRRKAERAISFIRRV